MRWKRVDTNWDCQICMDLQFSRNDRCSESNSILEKRDQSQTPARSESEDLRSQSDPCRKSRSPSPANRRGARAGTTTYGLNRSPMKKEEKHMSPEETREKFQ